MSALALLLHVCWIGFVIFGALWTRNRPVLAALHIASLVWGAIVELSPLPCPLTLLEEYTSRFPYRGAFVAHYLERLLYPELPEWLLTAVAVAVCAVNLGIYAWRYARARACAERAGQSARSRARRGR